MRKLLKTTAIVAIAASPLAAQSDPGPMNLPEAVSSTDITVADLLDQTVYVRTGDVSDDWLDWTDVPDGWEASGEINDLMLGKDGTVESVVLSQGGLLDIGDTEVQVDIAKFGIMKDSDDAGQFFVVFTGMPSELKSARLFDGLADDQASAATEAGTNAQAAPAAGNVAVSETGSEAASNAAEASGTGAETVSARGSETGSKAESQTAVTEMASGDGVEGASNTGVSSEQKIMGANAKAAEEPAPETNPFTGIAPEELKGVAVLAANDKRVGEIGSLQLNDAGDVTHAIVEMGGFLGLGETRVAVPIERFSLDREAGSGVLQAHVDMTKDEMKKLSKEAGKS